MGQASLPRPLTSGGRSSRWAEHPPPHHAAATHGNEDGPRHSSVSCRVQPPAQVPPHSDRPPLRGPTFRPPGKPRPANMRLVLKRKSRGWNWKYPVAGPPCQMNFVCAGRGSRLGIGQCQATAAAVPGRFSRVPARSRESRIYKSSTRADHRDPARETDLC